MDGWLIGLVILAAFNGGFALGRINGQGRREDDGLDLFVPLSDTDTFDEPVTVSIAVSQADPVPVIVRHGSGWPDPESAGDGW